ncbi:MAG: hypothetical protein LBF34_00625 [Puniceicoccales bacterium]|jgi:hypothetical protein|nr:hypothetical protein [Puniceicoccales bacterium]
MSLIFEGLKRSGHLKKQSAKTALQTELSEEVTDSPTVMTALLPETHSQALEEPELSPITVDYSPENNSSPKNDPVQIFWSKEPDTASVNEPSLPQTQPLEIQSQSTEIQHAPSTKQIEGLQNGFQDFRFAFEPKNSVKSDFSPAFEGGLANSLTALKSLIAAPYKLLKFLCNTSSKPIKSCFNWTVLFFTKLWEGVCHWGPKPIKSCFNWTVLFLTKLWEGICHLGSESINFCSNWTILFFTKLWEGICHLGSAIANVFTKLVQLCHFIILRLPISALQAVGSFFQWQWSFIRDYTTLGLHTLWATVQRSLLAIGSLFSPIFQCYRTALDKILSIYLPTSWIQNATIFLLKGSAIAISCCFAVVAIKNGIRSSTSQGTGDSASNLIALKENTTPQRKLKHFFKDPLVIKQEKVRDTLLAFHIDTVQRHGNGKGQIITDNKIFGIGSLLSEHPKIYLEKIGKNSLYFADKYGQQYKRSIGNMLE